MPFAISGNISQIHKDAIRSFSKKFGIILSQGQAKRQQYTLLQNALRSKKDMITDLAALQRPELLSLVFLITQFGDIEADEVPSDYTFLRQNPYVLEWQKNSFMIPLEVMEFLATEKIFKEQKYLFALIPQLPMREKKAWIRWMEVDFDGKNEWPLNHELHSQCRKLQIPFQGKSFITETEFNIEQLWRPGKNKIVDWFYKGLTPFYYAMQELSRVEKDPFFVHILETIRAGKFILKKEPEKLRQKTKYKLVATVEGQTPQLRKKVYTWEKEKEHEKIHLFSNLYNENLREDSQIQVE